MLTYFYFSPGNLDLTKQRKRKDGGITINELWIPLSNIHCQNVNIESFPRSAELLPENPLTWAPGSTLMGGDIEYKRSRVNGEWVTWLAMTLKLTKTSAVTGRKHTVVEFFSHSGPAAWFCPIAALQKYSRVVHNNKKPANLPLMRTEAGKGYTGRVFNQDLRELLAPVINYQEGPGILSHSFRAGMKEENQY